MTSRSLLSSLALCVAVWGAAVVEAQQPRRVPDVPDAQSDLNPRHERAKIEAQEAYQRGNHEHAVELTTSVLRENPEDHVAYYLRGSARIEIGNRQRNAELVREGIADARQALTLTANAGEIQSLYYLPYLFGMTNLADIENRPEHAETSVAVAERAVALPDIADDERANLFYQLGMAHRQLQDYDAAITALERAIRYDGQHMGAFVGLAETYAQAERQEEARGSYDQLVRTFPDSPLVYNNRGIYRQSQGDTQGAVADFTQAVEIDANFTVAYINRGFARLAEEDPKGAEDDFSAALKLNPGHQVVYSLRGSARLAQGEARTALDDFSTRADLEPRNPLAHVDLGFARFFAEDYQGALASFDQALEIQPQLRHVNPWRYWSMKLSGEPEASLEQVAKTVGKNADERDWIDHLMAFVVGETSDEDLLNAVDTSNPDLKDNQLCEAHYFIGRRQAEEGNDEAAEEHFQQALETNAKRLSAFRGAQFALNRFEGSEGESSDFSRND